MPKSVRASLSEEDLSGEKLTYHSTVATVNIYLIPQYNEWEVLRIRWAGLNIKERTSQKSILESKLAAAGKLRVILPGSKILLSSC